MLDEQSATALRRIESNDSRLHKLCIGDLLDDSREDGPPTATSPHGMFESNDAAEYSRLGDSIGRNTTLTSLKIRVDQLPKAVATSAFLGGIESNSSIHSLSLDGCYNGYGMQILNSFRDRRCLRNIHLCACFGIDDHLVPLLASSLAHFRGVIRDISIVGCEIGDEWMADLVAVLRGNELESIDLRFNDFGRSGCYTLSALLQQLDSSLITLDVSSNNIDDEGADAIVRSLRNSNKLEELNLRGNEQITEIRESSLSEIVCNTASVNATYLSNHTLRLVLDDEPHTSLLTSDCCRWLECNERADESSVAMEKILGCHPQLDMAPFFEEWDVKFMPLAVNWFDTATQKLEAVYEHEIGARKLSAVYQFVREKPLACVPAATGNGVKRKRNEVSDEVSESV